MKHKTLLLMALIPILFVVQQAQTGAETLARAPVLAPLEVPFSPPDAVSVTYYQLDTDGIRIEVNRNPVKCIPKKNNNTGDYSYGCTEKNHADGWYYPYPSNPYSDPMEDDYLPNVLAREMDSNTYPNPESQMAQAVAARTFAYAKGYLWRNTYAYDNSITFQVDVPYAFNINLLPLADRPDEATPPPPPPPQGSNLCNLTGLNAAQQLTCDAINGTQGVYLSKNGDANHNPIDAEFHSDIVGATISDTQTYLIRVEDPVSTGCDAVTDRTNGWGMSQRGATRWGRGNQCAVGGDYSTSWIVKWNDSRQILAHYYTGIDFVNWPATPNNRWNLLKFNNNNPIVMSPGATNTFDVMLQNTSTTDWYAYGMEIGYQWTPVNGAAQSENWQVAEAIPLGMVSGKAETIPVPLTAPTSPGAYDLHLDVRYSGSALWFSDWQWPDAKVAAACVGQGCAGDEILQGSDDAGPDFSCAFSTAYPEVYFGSCADGRDIISGFRFQDIMIPQNATIQSAYIVFSVDGTYTNPITVRLYAEKSANPPTYSASVPPGAQSRLDNLTGSYATWSITDTWSLGGTATSPDLSPIIQEIVNQGNLANGGPVSIIVKNDVQGTTHRRVIAYERAFREPGRYAARLVVTYTQ